MPEYECFDLLKEFKIIYDKYTKLSCNQNLIFYMVK